MRDDVTGKAMGGTMYCGSVVRWSVGPVILATLVFAGCGGGGGGSLPGAFSLTAPTDTAAGLPLNGINLAWTAASGAESYTLTMSTSSSMTPLLVEQTGISGTGVVYNNFASATTYYWQVEAVNATGTTVATGAPYSFTTGIAPGTFDLHFPTPGVSGVSTQPNFTWTASTAADSYTLEVRLDEWFDPFDNIITETGIAGISFTPSTPLANNTVYYWTVTAVNTIGSRGPSNDTWVYSFTTAPTPTGGEPGAFSHVSPAADATGVATTPTLTWQAASGVDSYWVNVATSGAQYNLTKLLGLGRFVMPPTTSYTMGGIDPVPLQGNAYHWWQVEAYSAAMDVTYATGSPTVFKTTGPALSDVTPTWSQLVPDGEYRSARPCPSPRPDAAAVYSPSQNMMVIFGGDDFFSGVWGLTNANGNGGAAAWVSLSPIGPVPYGRVGCSAVYDDTNDRMIVFGGVNPSFGYEDAVYVLADATGAGGTPTWSRLYPTGTPPPGRSDHTAVYDAANNLMIVFGGSGPLNDVWVLTNANGLGGTPAWAEVVPSGTPPDARYDHSAVYDVANDRMIVFGGRYLSTYYNDVWVLDAASGAGSPQWVELFPTGGPPTERYGHGAVYSPASNVMTVFGGALLGGGYAGLGGWKLTDANGVGSPQWVSGTSQGGPPSGRGDHSVVYDEANSRLIFFGGRTDWPDYYDSNSAWVLTAAD